MASTYLTKTLGTPTNNKKFTFSCWVKKIAPASTMDIFHSGADGSNEAIICRFESEGYITIKHDSGGSQEMLKQTNAKYRDPNAWYHIVIVFDTDNSTAEDRQRIYVNGERITEWLSGSDDNFSQGDDVFANKATSHTIGKRNFDNNFYLDAVLSHVHFCDGQAYDASYFGSTDATTGEWKINTSPSVTYGNNGFFILKDGNSVTDQSGNGNNWSVGGGTLTKTEDCPSNVFCTMSSLDKYAAGLSNGATTVSNENNSATIAMSTLAVNSGKWYWEAKVGDSASDTFNVGVRKTGLNNYNVTGAAYSANAYVYAVNGYIYSGGTDVLNTGTTATVGDIISFILDMDAGTLKLKKNGSDIYSGNPVVTGLNTGDHWHVVQGASQALVYFNFGNGYFGTTAVSSAGTNASGIGIFEYDVPANHTALSTKGLNL
tara:strand:+ start:122 stop:1414 length:1293 start_codon:yes stop_codon:yes gene_type:complete